MVHLGLRSRAKASVTSVRLYSTKQVPEESLRSGSEELRRASLVSGGTALER